MGNLMHDTNIRILIWTRRFSERHEIVFWKNLAKVMGWDCRHASEFKEISFDNQYDFLKILNEFKPHVVATFNGLSCNLPVHVPQNVLVFSYWDMMNTQFSLFGMDFFNHIKANDYVVLPFLDYQKFDYDNVYERLHLNSKFITYPFMPSEYVEDDNGFSADEVERFSCDVVLAFHRKDMAPYFYYHQLQDETFYNREIIRLDVEIARRIHDMIIESEGNFSDFDWLETIVIEAFDELGFWKYSKDRDKLLQRWKREALTNFFVEEYPKCIVDWLCEGDFAFKLWGPGWEHDSKYEKVAAGKIPEGHTEIYKIYRYSKLSINTAISLSLHRRIFESMKEKCMVVQCTCAEDILDVSSYRHFFIPDESIVACEGKKELLQKIDYYLAHEEERKRIAQNAYHVLEEKKLFANDVLLDLGRKIEDVVRQHSS